jgi:alginate O-acetyltransferase complex protein AlgI
MENFRWPIVARNIGDFWTRWHITLADWCRTYVYMPALGLTRSPYRAAYASFAVIGLWHAGALAFLLWGLYHATGIAVFQVWRRTTRRRRPAFLDRRPWCWTGIVLTNLFVTSSFAITMGWAGGRPLDGLRIYLKLFGIQVAG